MRRIHRLPSEGCAALIALLALCGCTGQDKDLGSSEPLLKGGPKSAETDEGSGALDAGSQVTENPAAATDAGADTEPANAPAVNLDPVPEMPGAAEEDATQAGDSSEPDADDTAPAEQADETDEADDTEPSADQTQQPDSLGDEISEPDGGAEDPVEPAPSTDAVEDTAGADAGANVTGPEFGPPRLVYRGGSGGSFDMCSDVTFEQATEPGTIPEQLLGVWVGEIEATALDLPSGSGRVTLTLAQEGATVVFGEVEESGLIPAPWPAYVGPREGFVYSVPIGEATQDVEFEGELYELVVDFTLSQNEPLEPHCQARHPNPVTGTPGCYTCLPGVISSWERYESDVNGICVVDEKYSLPCSELGLCWQDCLCDAETCHYRPGFVSQLRLNAEGQLALPIDFYWLLYGSGFTSNAPGDALWALLERQP